MTRKDAPDAAPPDSAPLERWPFNVDPEDAAEAAEQDRWLIENAPPHHR